ncbi:hypothetical protein ACP4OV_031385 [Aristida adscensionis]
MLIHMAAIRFLLVVMPIPCLLLLIPVMQAQRGYPSATAPTRWINRPPLHEDYNFTEGPFVRMILLHDHIDRLPRFAAGFYCAPPCDEFLFAVYIVSVDIEDNITAPMDRTARVVWAANRGRPVQEDATLSLTSAGGLVLRDADGSLVWTADTSGKAVARLKITKSGNLVLLDDKNALVWQSFDHPTDCLLPGQILAEGMMLTPNISTTNFTANDQLHITVRDASLLALVGSSPPQVYYSNSLDSYASDVPQNASSYIVFINGSITIYKWGLSYLLITLPPLQSLQYMRFEPDGHLRLYEWEDWKQDWAMVQDVLALDACDYPTVCGKYGLCNNGQCSCPSYFRPVDSERINLGCMPVTPVLCESAQDHHALFRASDGTCLLPTQLFSLDMGPQDYAAYIKVQITHSPPSSTRPSPKGNHVQVDRSSAPSTRTAGTIVGVIIGSAGAFIVLLLFIALKACKRRKRYEDIDDEGDLGELPGMPTRFTFEQLKVATEQFREKLGQGGFGSVYMGQLDEERIAVKCLDPAGQGNKEFLAEVRIIGGIHHVNLVRLVGFCAERSQRLLVYEYMSKGSLDRWIYYRHDNAPLGWNTRCSIIMGIAKGLSYLHEECRQRIAHFDIKPQNILLDDNFNAKVSDFGLAKLIDRDNSQVMTKMRGTPGCFAPEWLTSQITEKADIYSFGVVVMEVISGRKNLDSSQPEETIHLISLLQEKARTNNLADLIDKNSEDMQMHKEEVVGMMKLAMWCLQIDWNKRPQMSIVVKVLEDTIELETNIDYKFVATIPVNLGSAEKTGSSALHLASHLSGPR